MTHKRVPTRATAHRFLRDRSIAVIATKSEHGELNSSTITYILTPQKTIQFVTGNGTSKYCDIADNGKIALTVVDQKKSIAVNITGDACAIDDREKIHKAYREIGNISTESDCIPNVFKHQHGQPVVIEIKIDKIQYTDYSSNELNAPNVVTNL